ELLQATSSQIVLGHTNGEKSLSIYDLQGKVLFSSPTRFVDGQATVAISLAQLQVYLIKVEDEVIKFSIK
ncbi:MAG: hypothetical protein AAFO69_16455, partial [Bacteroidota bacterium]